MRVMTWRKVRISSPHLESAGVALSGRQTDLIHAACRRRGGLSADGQFPANPTLILSRHIHLAAVPLAAAPTVFTRRRRSRTICRCAPGAFGRADVAIYIYNHIQTRRGDKVRATAEGGADVTAALSHQRYNDLSSSFQKYAGGEVGTQTKCKRQLASEGSFKLLFPYKPVCW